MSDAVVVGAGMVPFGKYPQTPITTIGADAVVAAMRDAGVGRAGVDAIYSGNSYGGSLVAQRVVRNLGLGGIPVVNVENACSSSATALREAFHAISLGVHETVLVLGVEKLTALGGGPLPLNAEDQEAANGQIMPAVYAMRARRYLHERSLSPRDLAEVAVKARRHGTLNPYAYQRTHTTVDEVLASRPVATPLTLLQSCPSVDGAAALVVTTTKNAKQFTGEPVHIRASVLHSGEFETGFHDMTVADITMRSAHEAYAQAGITPQDLDVVELHDAFTIAELFYYEALQLAAPGNAIDLLRSGFTTFGGKTVVNPSGGLLAKGHPVGATGAAQAVEIVWQLRGQAEGRQVAGARFGLTHATGGGMAGVDHGACAIHIFERTTAGAST